MASDPRIRTRADLVQRAASILGIVQVGQDLSPEDAELIDAQVDPCLGSLAAREIVNVRPAGPFPVALFEELAACLAAAVPDYGRPLDSTVAEAQLRFMQRKGPSYQPLRVECF